jgi:hypothetical protein
MPIDCLSALLSMIVPLRQIHSGLFAPAHFNSLVWVFNAHIVNKQLKVNVIKIVEISLRKNYLGV